MSVAARHVAGSLWRNALAAAAAITLLALGVARALAHPGREFAWTEAIEQIARALPWIAPFFAAAATFAALERERALVALLASGRSLRRVGAWVLVAGLPFSAAALAIGSMSDGGAPSLGNERVLHASDGSLFVRSRAPEGSAARMSASGTSTLEWGRLEASGASLRFSAEQSWSASDARSSEPLLAGGSIELERVSRRPRASGVERARDALRPLVLLLVGIGAWLRPFGGAFARRLCAGLALAAGYLALELWFGIAAATGALPAAVGGFASAALFGGIGLARWMSADRPG